MHIKEFIMQSTVERLDQPVIRRLTWACVIEFDGASVCPVVQRPRRKFRSVIHGDRFEQAAQDRRPVQRLTDASASLPKVGL